MLTEAYLGALLVDEELADLVWELWDQGEMDNELVTITWSLIAISFEKRPCHRDQIQWTYPCPMSPAREF